MAILPFLLVKAIKIVASLGAANTDISSANTDISSAMGISSLGESGTGTPWSTEGLGGADSPPSLFNTSDATDSDSIGDIISNIIDLIF
jgi:hypothetical protein